MIKILKYPGVVKNFQNSSLIFVVNKTAAAAAAAAAVPATTTPGTYLKLNPTHFFLKDKLAGLRTQENLALFYTMKEK